MNWLDRYTEALNRHLPKDKREDITQEIRSILDAKIEEAEDTKGNGLSEEEILAMLKEFGHPSTVASRYHRPTSMTSDAMFPIYLQVVKYLILVMFVLLIASGTISASGQVDWWPKNMGQIITMTGFAWLAVLSSLFLFFYSVQHRSKLFTDWNPRSLSPVHRRTHIIPVFDSIFGMIADITKPQFGLFAH